MIILHIKLPGCLAQSGTCLVTDASLAADLGVASLLCLFFVALWSPVGNADLLAVECVVFCIFPKCVLFHIRING